MPPAEKEKEKTTVRLVFFGAAGVGKTALIQRFLQDRFEHRYKRTVEELHSVEYESHGAHICVEIMDTSGSYSFPAMRKLCIRHSDAFALVYSVCDPESFEEVQRLRDEILELKEDKFTPITVVGNKVDLEKERQVRTENSASTVELDWNASLVETSAKSGLNVTGLFEELLQKVHKVHLPCSLSVALQRRRGTIPKDCMALRRKPLIKKTNSCSVS
ncbi:GTP-binding protein Rhes-like [Scleropages formosus]|uniref:GTP-binding protein Rhes-like n=1 Tax=Scleropages formosus TaxID=113540 RepID=A0A0P7UGU5_SCLFO|nr:ras-related protein Rap-2a-like [Scleropages formosus]KPP69037.1 GTP-binding protein Rhes-like [Scleropages formosus]